MKDAVKTIGNIIDKQSVAFISSVDGDGFPNMKAMLAPRVREGIRTFYFTTNTSSRRRISGGGVRRHREHKKSNRRHPRG